MERSSVEVAELHKKFGSKNSRPGRFLETLVSPMLSDGVFAGGDWMVEAAPECLDAPRALDDLDRAHPPILGAPSWREEVPQK